MKCATALRPILPRAARATTIEAPHDPARHLHDIPADAAVLLDCATLWLSNVMPDSAASERETTALLAGLRSRRAPVIVISNEVAKASSRKTHWRAHFGMHRGGSIRRCSLKQGWTR